jgi:protoporphyrinogen oxidase
MPKYVVGHRQVVARVEAALPARVALAGSALNGVGVPDCIADGRRVARHLLHGTDGSPDVDVRATRPGGGQPA